MPHISWRRADELCDLMLGLKLAAVDPQQVLFAAVENLGDASTVFVLPVPVGPKRRKTPAGRPAGARPARIISI
jgi:hypothetical protein